MIGSRYRRTSRFMNLEVCNLPFLGQQFFLTHMRQNFVMFPAESLSESDALLRSIRSTTHIQFRPSTDIWRENISVDVVGCTSGCGRNHPLGLQSSTCGSASCGRLRTNKDTTKPSQSSTSQKGRCVFLKSRKI